MKFNTPYFLGGLVCVDFCNTFDHLHIPPRYDFLKDYSTVVDWGKAAGILSKRTASIPVARHRSLAELMEVRSLIYRILWPISRGESPVESDLVSFNIRMQKVSSKLRLVPTKGQYNLIGPADDPLERIVSETVRSAADLLVSNSFDRIRRCGGCGWLFFDTSRNHLRRWCSMDICGNRAKARRHYQRVKIKRTDAARKRSDR
jgi:predicted RNA-binding Zn ribbon-like protein